MTFSINTLASPMFGSTSSANWLSCELGKLAGSPDINSALKIVSTIHDAADGVTNSSLG